MSATLPPTQAFNNAGGRGMIESRMRPACSMEGNFDINKCCGEVSERQRWPKQLTAAAAAACLQQPNAVLYRHFGQVCRTAAARACNYV
jgi:organic hydroperoxide reductase OsmC/OhrA